MRAHFSFADMRGVNMANAVLHLASPRRAVLTPMALMDHEGHATGKRWPANLAGIDFSGADLCGADLRGADLTGATFNDAKLERANLGECNLSGVNWQGADVADAIFPNGAEI
jgi:uncharacterized protein YjbI with pentapeptide repeats